MVTVPLSSFRSYVYLYVTVCILVPVKEEALDLPGAGTTGGSELSRIVQGTSSYDLQNSGCSLFLSPHSHPLHFWCYALSSIIILCSPKTSLSNAFEVDLLPASTPHFFFSGNAQVIFIHAGYFTHNILGLPFLR